MLKDKCTTIKFCAMAQCLRPISVSREQCGRKFSMLVPCGRCPSCRRNQQMYFVSRCKTNAEKEGNVYFITLTYSDDKVTFKDIDYENPKLDIDYLEYLGYDLSQVQRFRTLNNKDITDWKKRVRRAFERKYGYSPQFSYLINGEYGPKTQRPHYHGFLTGVCPELAQLLINDWKENYGFVYFKQIPGIAQNEKDDQVKFTSRYVAKYTVKPIEHESPLVKMDLVEKPRKISSIGFGRPEEQKLVTLRHWYLCFDLFGSFDISSPLYEFTDIRKLLTLVKEIISRLKSKPISPTLKKQIFYVPSQMDSSKIVPSSLYRLVSYTIQRDLDPLNLGKLEQLASCVPIGDPIEAFRYVLIHQSEVAKDIEQSTHAALLEDSRLALSKSRF